MRRLTTALATTLSLCAGLAQADSTVRFWYHFDNADNPTGALVAKFDALGDKVSAAPVPAFGGGQWTSYGDKSTAVMADAEDPEAAWKWIRFLSSEGNNTILHEATGQLPVVKADSKNWTLHPQRFVKATVDSLPFAHILPSSSATADFVNTVWPTEMQRVLTGDIEPVQMNEKIDALFND
ncbi:extracellular solute-binding protein [Salipiger sp. 1_MG-2023]|uniref:extracellular solute-binding protein n=1 Tax=Salipiger sp. 1_MG-2023 TaxID=3062665 RepID=UPI0026E36E42|nr:extracellular solute-binding protein [Salipiger sp. 1_MG-2023]MDO6586700.1 extracellular solute-binding protein [Salipiger sp. 1_MG-2023]